MNDNQFDNSRTRELLDAEKARGGPQPAAAMCLLYTEIALLGLPRERFHHFMRAAAQAVVLAAGEKKKTFLAICAILDVVGRDLDDFEAPR
jgi:hypothetical protein